MSGEGTWAPTWSATRGRAPVAAVDADAVGRRHGGVGHGRLAIDQRLPFIRVEGAVVVFVELPRQPRTGIQSPILSSRPRVKAVRSAGISSICIRPSPFLSNFLSLFKAGKHGDVVAIAERIGKREDGNAVAQNRSIH